MIERRGGSHLGNKASEGFREAGLRETRPDYGGAGPGQAFLPQAAGTWWTGWGRRLTFSLVQRTFTKCRLWAR